MKNQSQLLKEANKKVQQMNKQKWSCFKACSAYFLFFISILILIILINLYLTQG